MKRLILLAPLLLIAAQDAPDEMALATLNVQQDGTRGDDGVYRGGRFALVDRFAPPREHGPRDALIAFEGPGWESDKVAYRLYLDERNVPDIFGKKLPGAILPRIGQGKDDYHAMADWGQDILQVNQTLGIGGLGVLRGGKVTQLGPSDIVARIANAKDSAEVTVENRGFAGDGGSAYLTTSYMIRAGSPVTQVSARVIGAAPEMVAGMIRNPGMARLQGSFGDWHYLASWGKQSLAGDALGLALFYNSDYVRAAEANGDNYTLAFCDPLRIRYAFAATWVQQPGAPQDEAGYRAWLSQTVEEMAATSTPDPIPACR